MTSREKTLLMARSLLEKLLAYVVPRCLKNPKMIGKWEIGGRRSPPVGGKAEEAVESKNVVELSKGETRSDEPNIHGEG